MTHIYICLQMAGWPTLNQIYISPQIAGWPTLSQIYICSQIAGWPTLNQIYISSQIVGLPTPTQILAIPQNKFMILVILCISILMSTEKFALLIYLIFDAANQTLLKVLTSRQYIQPCKPKFWSKYIQKWWKYIMESNWTVAAIFGQIFWQPHVTFFVWTKISAITKHITSQKSEIVAFGP